MIRTNLESYTLNLILYQKCMSAVAVSVKGWPA